jgi:general secretion pathway protein K
MNRRHQRGLALVSVLWGVSILSLITTAMLTASLTGARMGRNEWNAVRAGAAADGAVQMAILSLMDDRPDHQPRIDGTASNRYFDGVSVRVRVQAEAGKINVNFADKDLMSRLFQFAGLSKGDADALADEVVARRAAASPTRAFKSLDELLTVPGMSQALFERLVPMLTVYGTSGVVDSKTTPLEVLRALPDLDGRDLVDILTARDEAYAAMRQSSNMTAAPLGTMGASFTITAESRVDGALVVRKAVVLFTEDAKNPYLIQDWS